MDQFSSFGISAVLIGLPVAFVLGWLASRLDVRQWKLENRYAPKAYFRGLNHLLNAQQDAAIDAFIEAVQNDPDTSELHFALGNLFRKRGEYERAVRVHSHLLARSDISSADRQRAQYALGQDYLKAGLLDRAEEALLKLQGTPLAAKALWDVLSVLERTRDWAKARRTAEQLEVLEAPEVLGAAHSSLGLNAHATSPAGSYNLRYGHYLCEEARALKADPAQGTAGSEAVWQAALALLSQAKAHHPVRGLVEQGLLHFKLKNYAAACEAFAQLSAQPHVLPIVAQAWQNSAVEDQKIHPASKWPVQTRSLLLQAYEQTGAWVLLKAAQFGGAVGELGGSGTSGVAGAAAAVHPSGVSDALSALAEQHLERSPKALPAVRDWAAQQAHTPPAVLQALDAAVKPLHRYRCAACGFEAAQYFWQCPGCQNWDSYPFKTLAEL